MTNPDPRIVTSGPLPYLLSVPAGNAHVGSATRAYRDGRIYDWLLARRR